MELAYLDPGSGSIILQALLGGAAGVAVAGKFFGGRFVRFLKSGKSREISQPSPGQGSPPTHPASPPEVQKQDEIKRSEIG